MLVIKELQAPKGIRFPVARLYRAFTRYNFLLQLPRKKIPKMRANQILEILQVRIVTAGLSKRTLFFPARKKLLNGVPLPEERCPILFRLRRRGGSRSIPVDAQLGESWSSVQLIQHPGDFVIVGVSRPIAIRHHDCRRYPGSEPGPENRDNQIVRSSVWDSLLVVLIELKILILPEAGTQP